MSSGWETLSRSSPGGVAADSTGRGRGLLAFYPGPELGFGHDMGCGAHQRVSDSAQQVAYDRVAAQTVGRRAPVGDDARDHILLQAEGWDPERVDHVLGAHAEVHRLALGQVQLVAVDRSTARHRRRILVGPHELLAGDAD